MKHLGCPITQKNRLAVNSFSLNVFNNIADLYESIETGSNVLNRSFLQTSLKEGLTPFPVLFLEDFPFKVLKSTRQYNKGDSL